MRFYGITSKYFSLGVAITMFALLFARMTEQQPEPYRIGDYPWQTISNDQVEQFPLLPDCSFLPDYADRKNCSDKTLLKYVYKHVRYPQEAKDAGAEGMVVVRFSVDASGRVGVPVVVRSPHPALAKASLEVMRKTLDKYPVWEAGRRKGKPALMEFNMPIKYVLKDDGTAAVVVGEKIRYMF